MPVSPSPKSHSQGYNFHNGGALALTIERLKAENAKRVKCKHCALMILDMDRHMSVCHPDSRPGA